MPLFRYLDRQYVDEFRKDGKLLISPLYKYRSIDDIRQDPTEGLVSTSITSGKFSSEEAKSILGIDNQIEIGPGGALVYNNHLPNGYLVSTSTVRGSHLMTRFKCDDYFIINDPKRFSEAISSALSANIGYQVHGKVIYVRQKLHHQTVPELIKVGKALGSYSENDYFIKKESYKIESEYRFLFFTKASDPVQPTFIQITQGEVQSCCSFRATRSKSR
jgi:hypothetical protein